MSDLAPNPNPTDQPSSWNPLAKEPRIDSGHGVLAMVEELLMPMLEDKGFDLIRMQLSGQKTKTLQIMAEPSDGSIMTVEFCGDISVEASAIMDVEDLIEAAYHLEVSSPGLDRPLTRPCDFTRWQGYEVKLETSVLIEGRKRFRGELAGWQDDAVLVDTEEGTYVIRFADIVRAKLTLSDDLVADAMKGKLPGLPTDFVSPDDQMAALDAGIDPELLTTSIPTPNTEAD